MNTSESTDLLTRLERTREAYHQLHTGAGTLLTTGSIYWTERPLLNLVRALYGRRLEQVREDGVQHSLLGEGCSEA